MTQPTIIGIHSPWPRCGKSTVAEWLVRERGFIRHPFAATLKAMVRILLMSLGYSQADIDRLERGDKTDIIEEAGGCTLRHIYVTLGTEWGRDLIHPRLWVNAWEQSILNILISGNTKIVTDDIRFIDEVNAVKNLGGRLIYVRRDATKPVGEKKHKSEAGLPFGLFDMHISNQSTIEALYNVLGDSF